MLFCFFKQKTAYEMRISDWSSDVCSSDITVDTEFMRETTYWPKVCLIQIAGPEVARVIDPLAEDLSLDPLLDLLRNRQVLTVFHAARQDLEIFPKLMGEVPAPPLDSQAAPSASALGPTVSARKGA